MDEFSIIEIYSGTLWESEMIKSLLESAEIKSFLKNSISSTYAYEAITMEGVKVMISASDFERTKEIVEGYLKTQVH